MDQEGRLGLKVGQARAVAEQVEDAAEVEVLDDGGEGVGVEDCLVEDAVINDVVVGDTFVEDAALEDAAVEDAAVEDAAAEDAVVEYPTLDDAAVDDATDDDAAVVDETAEDCELDDPEVSGTLLQIRTSLVPVQNMSSFLEPQHEGSGGVYPIMIRADDDSKLSLKPIKHNARTREKK